MHSTRHTPRKGVAENNNADANPGDESVKNTGCSKNRISCFFYAGFSGVSSFSLTKLYLLEMKKNETKFS